MNDEYAPRHDADDLAAADDADDGHDAVDVPDDATDVTGHLLEHPAEQQIDHAEPAGGRADQDGLPPLAVRGPDGRRVTVTALASRHTVGELADALGIRRRSPVHIDGRVADRKVRLDRSSVVQGSDVTGKPGRSPCTSRTTPRPGRPVRGHLDAPATPSSPPATRRGVVAVVESGPAAGAIAELGPGRHLVGRSAGAELRLADSHVELHHAVIDVDASDPPAATLTQLTGRVPCRVATPPATTPGEPVLELTTLAPGAVVQIGASRVRIGRRDAAGDGGTDSTMAGIGAPPAALAPLRGDPWRMTLHRRPRQLPEWDPEPIDPPAAAAANAARAAGGLIAVVLSLAGGVAMAVVFGHPMFLMFSALGLLGYIGTRISGKLADRKHRRRSAAESKRDRERFASDVAAQRAARLAHHLATAPTIAAALATACGLTAPLWMRRADHSDAFIVSLGRGTATWRVRLAAAGAGALSPEAEAIVDAAANLDDVPVMTDLGPDRSLALVGAHADAVARALVLQLAALTGPADWRLVVVADDATEWEWCTWLPHASSGADASAAGGPLVVDADDAQRLSAVLARLDDGDQRHVVVVTDRPELLATRTGALRRYLGTTTSAAVVAVVRPGAVAPSMCRSLLEIGSLCTARWCPETSATTGSSTLHAAGLARTDADAAARRLAGVHDPEDPAEAAGAIPAAIGNSRLFARCGLGAVDDPIAIAARWRPARHPDADAGDGHPRAALGVTSDGVVEIDLVRDGPHALIAGTTGAGKSELLRTFVGSLAARSSPDDLTFVLIDYKGGSTFDACADLPHTVGVVTDLDDRLAERALASLEAEIRRRERLLRGAGADNLDAYRAQPTRPGGPLPRLVVVIDEFAAMAKELPGFIPSLVGIAQRGRSLGIHLILATQRPAGVVSDDIRANTNLRIALRLQDRADAMDIVGVADPASFPRGTPGRAMLRLGPGETLVFQTAHSSGPHQTMASGGLRTSRGEDAAEECRATELDQPSELGVLVRSVRGAASLCEIAPPIRPWLEALPRVISAADVATLGPGAVGLVDDPDSQAQYALRWEPADGNLALVGSLGSGTTTTLRTLLVDAVRADTADGDTNRARPHVYVLDGRGDGRLDEVAALPECGAVVGVNEGERRTRLVRFLSDELARRKAATADADTARPIVLAVDGLGTLLAAVGGPGEMDEHAKLVRVLADGVGVGIHAVATLDRPTGVPAVVLASFGQRWLFHVDDPMDAVAFGVKVAHVPPAIPGRIVVTSTRLEAQIAVLPLPPADLSAHDDPAHVAVGATPVPIETLSASVDATMLPSGSSGDGTTELPIGLDFTTLQPTALDVPDGEHVIVVGPARSGRSTALVRIVAAWRQAHPDGVVIVSCPRRNSPLLGWATRSAPGCVVADDAAEIVAAARSPEAGEEAGRHERRPVLIAADDAERVEDASGALLALVNEHSPDVTVAAAGRPDALRALYGHWTSVVRRSRIGLVMSTSGDADGELLGEPLPRRSPIPARQGLAWAFDATGRRLVQVARDGAEPVAAAGSSLSTARG